MPDLNPVEQMMADEFSRNMRYLIVQFSSNSDIPYTGMEHFSCAEADALADVIKLSGLPLGLAAEAAEAAAMLIGSHAAGDQPGDAHYVEHGTIVTTWVRDDQIPRKCWIADSGVNEHGRFRALRIGGPTETEPRGPAVELHIAAAEPYEE